MLPYRSTAVTESGCRICIRKSYLNVCWFLSHRFNFILLDPKKLYHEIHIQIFVFYDLPAETKKCGC
jgi:hypothetical protein